MMHTKLHTSELLPLSVQRIQVRLNKRQCTSIQEPKHHASTHDIQKPKHHASAHEYLGNPRLQPWASQAEEYAGL